MSTTSPLRLFSPVSCWSPVDKNCTRNIVKMALLQAVIAWACNSQENDQLEPQLKPVINDLCREWLWQNMKLSKLNAQGAVKAYSDNLSEYRADLKSRLFTPGGADKLLYDLAFSTHWRSM